MGNFKLNIPTLELQVALKDEQRFLIKVQNYSVNSTSCIDDFTTASLESFADTPRFMATAYRLQAGMSCLGKRGIAKVQRGTGSCQCCFLAG